MDIVPATGEERAWGGLIHFPVGGLKKGEPTEINGKGPRGLFLLHGLHGMGKNELFEVVCPWENYYTIPNLPLGKQNDLFFTSRETHSCEAEGPLRVMQTDLLLGSRGTLHCKAELPLLYQRETDSCDETDSCEGHLLVM